MGPSKVVRVGLAFALGGVPFQLPAEVPGVLAAPTAQVSGDGAVSLAWEGAPDATSYRVRWSTDGVTFTNVRTGDCTAPTEHLCTATDLTGGAVYRFEVAAVNDSGGGPWSPASDPVTAVAAPGVPAVNAPTVSGPGAVAISWSTPTGTVDSYRVYVSTSMTGDFALIDNGDCAGTTANSCTVQGKPGVQYFFEVSAVHSGVEGVRSDASAGVTAIDAPATPDKPFQAARDGRTVWLGWTSVANAPTAPVSWYRLQLSTSDGVSYVDIRRGDCLHPTANSCHLRLAPCRSYRFRVAAVNDAGQGAFSDPSDPIALRWLRPWPAHGWWAAGGARWGCPDRPGGPLVPTAARA